MKMVKKILLGLAAVSLIAGTVSCKMGAGEGDVKGDKWDLTMTVDATPDAQKPIADENTYRRYWKQFSTSEKVAEISTTITINTEDFVYPNITKACVVGYIFDCNKNTTDNKKVDFCLLGVNPMRQKFYVERYTNITKGDKEEYDVPETQKSLGASTDIGYGDYKRENIDTWCSLNNKMYTVSEDGKIITCVVKITQENKKYSVYLGSVKVGEYDASESTYVEKIDGTDYAVGGIACYGNAEKGVKLVANYKTEKDAVTGKLEAEEIE